MPRLEEVCVQVLLRQMCRLFSSFGLDRFFELFPRLPRFALERLVVDSARTLDLPIRIDHQANCLRFVQNLSVLSSTHSRLVPALIQTVLSHYTITLHIQYNFTTVIRSLLYYILKTFEHSSVYI